MIIPTVGRLDAIGRMNNAAYGWMSAADSMLNLCSFTGLSNMNLDSVRQAEQNLTMSMLQNNLIYKLSSLQEESLKKLEDENIKRTFSTFA